MVTLVLHLKFVRASHAMPAAKRLIDSSGIIYLYAIVGDGKCAAAVVVVIAIVPMCFL